MRSEIYIRYLLPIWTYQPVSYYIFENMRFHLLLAWESFTYNVRSMSGKGLKMLTVAVSYYIFENMRCHLLLAWESLTYNVRSMSG